MKERILARLERRRIRILKCLGKFPSQVTPQLIRESKEDLEDIILTKVRYFSSADQSIPAYLLEPKGFKRPLPGLINLHGHGGYFEYGKSKIIGRGGEKAPEWGSQALEACRKGFIVLAPDQLCFEERRPPKEIRKNNPYQADGFYERFTFCNEIARGRSLQTRYVVDTLAAVDVLSRWPGVDPERLGVFGQSLGGQQSLWAMLADKRLKVGVCSCGVALLSAVEEAGIGHNLAMYVPGMLKICDCDGLVESLAPRPLLILAGRKDIIFPVKSVEKIAKKVKRIYSHLGASDRFECHIHQLGHSFHLEMRAKAYNWLDKWLKSSPF
jgi:dienelactone hydrolase